MKFTFPSFVVGFGCAVLSLGVVTYANASGGSTITACANKSTGALRLLSKGSCKKTERKVAWNQQGVQGVQGPQGVQGMPGVNSSATSESAGQGSVYDAAGTYIGQLVDVSDGSWYDEYKISRDGVYFHLGSDGGIYSQVFFNGSNCTGTPFIYGDVDRQWPRQLSQSEVVLTLAPGSQAVRWYRPNSGSLTLLTPASVMSDYFSTEESNNWIDQVDGVGTCTNLTGRTAGLHRTAELISSPVEFTINSPLRLTPNN